MNEIVLDGELCRLRPYRLDEVDEICVAANDFMVARWMTRAFPHPYERADAQEWIVAATSGARGTQLAIEVEGRYAGGIGFEPLTGERTGTAIFGYWVARAKWGRGIATEAARMLADYALTLGEQRRLEASVFAQNTASARVLEKCGFDLEGKLRAIYLDRSDKVCDALFYARLKD